MLCDEQFVITSWCKYIRVAALAVCFTLQARWAQVCRQEDPAAAWWQQQQLQPHPAGGGHPQQAAAPKRGALLPGECAQQASCRLAQQGKCVLRSGQFRFATSRTLTRRCQITCSGSWVPALLF